MEQRKHPRLSYYDYATPGGYFVTICVKKRRPLFGDVPFRVGRGPCAPPNAARMIAEYWIARISEKYPSWTVDNWVVMPNHVHLVLFFKDTAAALTTAIGWFKTMSTNAYIRGVKDGVFPPFQKRLWQRSYYEHVIRNQNDLTEIRRYVAEIR